MNTEMIINRQYVLEEKRRALDKVYASTDVLDNKLQNLLNFCSIIVSIVVAVEASTFQSSVGLWFWGLLGMALLLYVTAFFIVRKGLKPVTFNFPISSDWEELHRRYFDVSETEALELLINEHTEVMKEINLLNEPKSEAVNIVSLLMFWIVLLLIAAVPIGAILK